MGSVWNRGNLRVPESGVWVGQAQGMFKGITRGTGRGELMVRVGSEELHIGKDKEYANTPLELDKLNAQQLADIASTFSTASAAAPDTPFFAELSRVVERTIDDFTP